MEKLKHEIQQELETHKTRLRKSEFLFQKEFEAASALAFMALRRSLILKYRFPEMDWHDACEDFAGDFDKVEGVPLIEVAEEHSGSTQSPSARLA